MPERPFHALISAIQRRVAGSPRLTVVVTVVGALIAAVLKQVAALSIHEPWSWKDLLQDTVQNAFIAVLVAYTISRIARHQERLAAERTQGTGVLRRLEVVALAVSGWNTIPMDPTEPSPGAPDSTDVLDALGTSARKLAELADRLDRLAAAKTDSIDSAKIAFMLLGTVPSGIRSYLLEGGRERRLVWLRLLVDDLSAIEQGPDRELAKHATACRKEATELAAWVQHTDATIIERLIVDGSQFSRDGASLARYRASVGRELFDVDQAAISFSPAYLLVDFLGAVVSSRPPEIDWEHLAPQISAALDVARRCINGLRFEVLCAATLNSVLERLVSRAYAVMRESA